MRSPGRRGAVLLMAMILLSAGAAVSAADRSATSGTATRPVRTIRVACIGDSITFGQGLQDRATQSYPARLHAMLAEYQPGRWDVRNFGVSGASALKRSQRPYWNTRPFVLAQAFEPDIVVIKLGTNDANPVNWKHKADFKRDLISMVEAFRGLSSEPEIWLCHPVPVFPGPHAERNRILRDEVIPLIDEVAEELELPVIDLYTALREQAAHFPDTVHPDAEGARLLAGEVIRALTSQQPCTTAPATTAPVRSP